MQQVVIRRADGSDVQIFGLQFATDVRVENGVLSLENHLGVVDFWYKLQDGESVSVSAVEETP